MARQADPIPLVIITGPTASGKSSLAVSLAQCLDAEIVNADAMAVYRGMDIGTAKPSPSERQAVPHHVLDCIEPDDSCHVKRWLELAEQAIADIHQRGKLPMVVGGSPLSIKALLEGLSAGTPRHPAIRAELEQRLQQEGGEALYRQLQAVDPAYASQRHPNDHRRVMRALEVYLASGTPYSAFHTTDGHRRDDYRSLILALQWEREELNRRINARCKAMFAQGLVDEVCHLAPRLSPEARQGVGYKEVIAYLEGAYDLETAQEKVRRASRHLAKHQHTWLRRFSDVRWLPGAAPDVLDQARQLCEEFLHKAES